MMTLRPGSILLEWVYRRVHAPSVFIFILILCLLGISDPRFTCQVSEEPVPNFNAERAFFYLQEQCDFGPRYPGSDAHKKARDYLTIELKNLADEVKLQTFTMKGIEMTNILARFGGGKGASMLLCAHWDTRPFADQDPNPKNRGTPILGANDGGSGVAVLLELAQNLNRHPPPNEVIIALFDGEDYGREVSNMFLGSTYFARHREGWEADFGILLDMVGDKDLRIPKERYSWQTSPDLMQTLWDRAADLGLAEFFPTELGRAIMDDHVPLIRAGLPTINLIDFDYPYWHTVEDTVDKCSPESLEIIGRLMLDYIYQ